MGRVETYFEQRSAAANNTVVPPAATCSICFEGNESEKPLMRGCACRGMEGYAHLECLVKAAWTHEETFFCDSGSWDYWRCCVLCHTAYTSELQQLLAQARMEKAKELPYMSDRYRCALSGLADCYYDLDNITDCEKCHRELVDYLAAQIKAFQTSAQAIDVRLLAEYAQSCNGLSAPLVRIGKFDEARKTLKEGLAALEHVKRESPDCMPQQWDADTENLLKSNIAESHVQQGNTVLAIPILEEVFEKSKKNHGEDDPQHLSYAFALICARMRHSPQAEDVELLKNITERAKRVHGPNHPQPLKFHALLDQLGHSAPSVLTKLTTATISGLQARPDLNGSQVDVVRYLPQKDRYEVRLKDGTKFGAKLSNLVLSKRSKVVIRNLVSAADLNGLHGVVGSFKSEKGRYAVNLDGKEKSVLVKPDNLIAI